MIDMTATIAPKSDQLNADDLIGRTMTIRITRVSASPESPEQPVAVFFEGDGGKPYKPCKSMRRVMVHCWGKDAANYVGRAMTLYRDPEVQFGGMKVGGIRISHMSHIDGEQSMALTATRAQRRLFKVRPLRIEQEQQDSGQRRQSPADWTAEFIEKMKAAPDLDALAEIQRKAERPIAKLKADHPDLHKRAADAAAARDRELRPNDGTLSAENPAASEGRADRDMGDAFADDPFASEEM